MVKAKHESKFLTTLFVLLDYIIYFANTGGGSEYPGVTTDIDPEELKNEDSKTQKSAEGSFFPDENLSNFVKTAEGIRIVDAIQALSLYLLLTFDWNAFTDLTGELQKDIIETPKLLGGGERKSGETDTIKGTTKKPANLLSHMSKTLSKLIGKTSSNISHQFMIYREIHFGLFL